MPSYDIDVYVLIIFPDIVSPIMRKYQMNSQDKLEAIENSIKKIRNGVIAGNMKFKKYPSMGHLIPVSRELSFLRDKGSIEVYSGNHGAFRTNLIYCDYHKSSLTPQEKLYAEQNGMPITQVSTEIPAMDLPPSYEEAMGDEGSPPSHPIVNAVVVSSSPMDLPPSYEEAVGDKGSPSSHPIVDAVVVPSSGGGKKKKSKKKKSKKKKKKSKKKKSKRKKSKKKKSKKKNMRRK